VRTVAAIFDAGERPAEIVVVDQSDEPNAELQHTEGVRYVHERTSGASRARNRAAALARWPVLVFVDDDVRPRPGWLAPLALPIERDRGVVTCSRVLAGTAAPGTFVPSVRDDGETATFRGRVGRDVLWTGATALDRTALDRVGGFDERLGPGRRFPAAEDNDLGHRLLEAGYTIVHIPDSVVVHDGARPMSAYLPLRRAYGLGQGAFYAKHASTSDLYTLRRLAVDVGVHLGRSARHALTRSRYQTAGDVVYSAAVVEGAARWLLSGRGRASVRR
jgi:glycosyltransferase involved in cell wall biosynthesis